MQLGLLSQTFVEYPIIQGPPRVGERERQQLYFKIVCRYVHVFTWMPPSCSSGLAPANSRERRTRTSPACKEMVRGAANQNLSDCPLCGWELSSLRLFGTFTSPTPVTPVSWSGHSPSKAAAWIGRSPATPERVITVAQPHDSYAIVKHDCPSMASSQYTIHDMAKRVTSWTEGMGTPPIHLYLNDYINHAVLL